MRSYPRKQNIFWEKLTIYGIYFIYKGKVKLVSQELQGKEQIVRLATDGDLLGILSANSNETYILSAFALDDSAICFIDNPTLFQALLENPQFSLNILLYYCNLMRRMEIRSRNFACMNVKEKVADSILHLYRTYGGKKENNKILLNAQLPHREIAMLCGTSEEQVSRTFSELVSEKLITVEGRKVYINDMDKLDNAVTCCSTDKRLL